MSLPIHKVNLLCNNSMTSKYLSERYKKREAAASLEDRHERSLSRGIDVFYDLFRYDLYDMFEFFLILFQKGHTKSLEGCEERG